MWKILHRRRVVTMSRLSGPLVGLYLWGGTSFAAGPEDIDFVVAASLPPEAAKALAMFPQTTRYALTARLNPYYLQGDFDGDGATDTALLIIEKATGKQGIAVVAGGQVMVVGAGQAFGNGGDDFAWMDAWYIYEKGTVEQGAFEGTPPKLRGDALMVIKTESASGLIYWSGRAFAWYQQGD
jgi:hypothetical protein